MSALKPDQMSDAQLCQRRRRLARVLNIGIAVWAAVILGVTILARMNDRSPRLVAFLILGSLMLIPVNNERKAVLAEQKRRSAAKQADARR